MIKEKTTISIPELKRLLTELVEKRPDICFRYRIIGEMWKDNFMRVLKVTDGGVILHDGRNSQTITVTALSHIIQFEIEKSFQSFDANFHYLVSP
jgi:hypothetical protein